MQDAFICDAVRTPFGRYGGSLATVRADDLAALPIAALMARNPGVDWARVDDLYFGCANQAGEDNRNLGHMAGLLAGLPVDVPGNTINRLCGSSLDAVGTGARVMGKAESAFSRAGKIEDTTMGWRFVNPLLKAMHGVDSMPETAENVARDFNVNRADQDAFALRSQQRWARANAAGLFKNEIVHVTLHSKKGESRVFDTDEHPRPDTTIEALAKLKGVVTPDGTVTAGNASGINDGAGAILIASSAAAGQYGLTPRARIVGMATVGIAPRIMGFGPAPATKKVLAMTGLTIGQMDVVELNEAFASQSLAVLRDLGLPDDAEHVNPHGGAIAVGHPLGASGARLVTAAVNELHRIGGRYALCTMCIGVGQGIALIIERV
jgi:acetyl-CoA acyltransferase